MNLIKSNDRYKKIYSLLAKVYKEINKDKPRVNQRFLAMYHECLGQLFLKAGDYKAAVENFTKAIESIPHGRAYYRLAQAYKEYAIHEKTAKRKSFISLACAAVELSHKHDLRNRYKTFVDTLQKELNALGGVDRGHSEEEKGRNRGHSEIAQKSRIKIGMK